MTDNKLCTATTTGTITQPPALVVTSTAGTISCFGGTTTVTVSASGGTPPYTGTGTFTRSAGAYSYIVTDFNKCTATTAGNITQPSVLVVTSTAGIISCYAGTTTVTVSASGGTPPYTGTGTFTQSAGTYSYTVTDFKKCIATTTGTITQPTALVVTSTAGTISCFGGTTMVTVTASGGTPSYTGTGTFTHSAGAYSYTVTDSKLCPATATGTITQPPALVVTSTAGTISCFGGTTTVTVSASGGTSPYTGTGIFMRSAGAYSYIVTDNKLCTATTTGTITQPTALVVTSTAGTISCFGGKTNVKVSASGGLPPYTYLWNTSPVQTTAIATGLVAGTYNVTVKDFRNCSYTAVVIINTQICSGFKTYTQGGYGAPPSGNNPGTYVTQKFALAFPSGLTVGCNKTLKLTSAQAVIDFLPSGGTPVALVSNLVNPTTYSNTLAGQVVTLKLSLVFDAYDQNFSPSSSLLGNLIIGSGTFTGWNVTQLMNEANKVLGGCVSSYSASQLCQ